MSKEKKIYKGNKIVAVNEGMGWVFISDEKRWLKSYIKKNKENIYNYKALKKLIRDSSIDNFFERIKCKMLKKK